MAPPEGGDFPQVDLSGGGSDACRRPAVDTFLQAGGSIISVPAIDARRMSLVKIVALAVGVTWAGDQSPHAPPTRGG